MMNWSSLLSSQRDFYQKDRDLSVSQEGGRTPFHKDHDRIVFSSAFRRLNRKTQVHPLSENDHVHSRLTHSLEVSCVGRSLGTHVAQGLIKKLPKHIDGSDIAAIVSVLD